MLSSSVRVAARVGAVQHLRGVRLHQAVAHENSANVLEGSVDVSSADFVENAAGMARVVGELRSAVAEAAAGGDARARKRHTDRGKMLVRDRIDALCDEGTPFLELSQLAGRGLYGADHVPGGGIVTGVAVCISSPWLRGAALSLRPRARGEG